MKQPKKSLQFEIPIEVGIAYSATVSKEGRTQRCNHEESNILVSAVPFDAPA